MPNAPDALTLVLATQRSGSTLLCRDIESLGGLGRPRESFLGLAEQAAHARAQGFAPHRTSVTRTTVKVIDEDLSDRLRESFLAYLSTETGLQVHSRTARPPSPDPQ